MQKSFWTGWFLLKTAPDIVIIHSLYVWFLYGAICLFFYVESGKNVEYICKKLSYLVITIIYDEIYSSYFISEKVSASQSRNATSTPVPTLSCNAHENGQSKPRARDLGNSIGLLLYCERLECDRIKIHHYHAEKIKRSAFIKQSRIAIETQKQKSRF